MVSTGVIPGDDIVTLTSDTHEFMMNRLQSEEDIKRFFKEYKSKVQSVHEYRLTLLVRHFLLVLSVVARFLL